MEEPLVPADGYRKIITLLKVMVYKLWLLIVNWEMNLHWQNDTSN